MKTLLIALVLFAPSLAHAQSTPSPTPIRLTIGAAIIAHGVDLSTTAWAFGLSNGRYVEANPILRPFAGDPVTLAVSKMTLAVGMNYGLLRLYPHRPKTAIAIGVMQIVATGYVAHRNAQLLGLR